MKFSLVGITLIVATLLILCGKPEPGLQQAAKGSVQPVQKHWEKAIPEQNIPEGVSSLSAQECGTCHQAIYREWQSSNHAIAFQDLQFQAEWAKDDSLWVCLNCHTPLQNQQKFIIRGKRNGDYFQPVKEINPHFDPALRKESITCAVCHVREGTIIGGSGSGGQAPHPVKKDPDFLSRKLCFTCHNVTDVLSPSLVCSFQTGDEWAAGPYPEVGLDCISCHMPLIYRPLTSDGKGRRSRRHTWVGSPIPKFPGGNKVVAGYRSGLEVELHSVPENPAPGDSVFLTASVTNQRAGHFLPTGDPEYFLIVNLRLADEQENSLTDTTLRIGQVWEWWPEAKKLSDNRLKPLEQRVYTLSAELPSTRESYFWEVTVTMHRMTVENATAMKLLGKYPIEARIYQRKLAIPATNTPQ